MAENHEQQEQNTVTLGQKLIPVVNKLQDICSQSGVSVPIDLPQVAVIGSQSSGKSSVIEALVGRDFLPRGTGVVTRRPLVLQLNQTKVSVDGGGFNDGGGGAGGVVEYGEFLHLPGKKFYDFAEIRKEIQAETEREAGANRGISERTIRLKIYSPNVLDITLIDLPGITRVPVGDQPSDIEARIRTMIMKYIRHPSCLILAVTPANSDLVNSDALQIAGNADPDGKRTIGVITKLDIMDRGTDACNYLLGKVIPLQLGYVGVVNRSQEDIMRNLSIKEALAAEERFFRSHPVYIKLADRCGIPQLAKKLNQILVQHIRDCLPALKAGISSQLVTVTKEYASYGEIPESRTSQGNLLLNILSKYSEGEDWHLLNHENHNYLFLGFIVDGYCFSLSLLSIIIKVGLSVLTDVILYINGLCLPLSRDSYIAMFMAAFSSLVEGKSEEISTSELSGGARVHYIFQSIFVKSLEEVDPCEGLSYEDIRTAIQNSRGPRSGVFAAEVPFEVLVRRQIARLLEPSLQCARFIYNELVKMSHSSMVSELQRYPVLRKRVDEVVGRFLRENLEPAKSIIEHIIEMEMDFINTSHPNFIGGSRALETALQQIRSSMAIVPVSRQRDGGESDSTQTSERSSRSGAIVRSPANGFIKSPSNGVISDQGVRANSEAERSRLTGSSIWGISSLFSGTENHSSAHEASRSNAQREPVYNTEHASSSIHLREPPPILRSSEAVSEQEDIEITATKLLLSSYFDIIRKIIQDSVPKAIMHFLVNHTKRELRNVLIQKLYRENLFEEMLQEPREVAAKRKHARETLRVLQQAFQTLDELPLEAEIIERGYGLGTDSIGLPKTHGLLPSSSYTTNLFTS